MEHTMRSSEGGGPGGGLFFLWVQARLETSIGRSSAHVCIGWEKAHLSPLSEPHSPKTPTRADPLAWTVGCRPHRCVWFPQQRDWAAATQQVKSDEHTRENFPFLRSPGNHLFHENGMMRSCEGEPCGLMETGLVLKTPSPRVYRPALEDRASGSPKYWQVRMFYRLAGMDTKDVSPGADLSLRRQP